MTGTFRRRSSAESLKTLSMPCVPLLALLAVGCAAQSPADRPQRDILRSDETRRVAEFTFSAADEKLLDEVQKACFLFFWKEVGTPACLAKDRFKGPVASIAAVGFQLSSLPIGVERGWITRDEGEQRARTVLAALANRSDNRWNGIYLHFPDSNTGGPQTHGYDHEVSTVDTALLFAGAIPAAQYFGGEVAELTDRMLREANWRAFAIEEGGMIKMSWRSANKPTVEPPGEFSRFPWHINSDEERLVYFLAAGSPVEAHAVDPALYYKLSRTTKRHADGQPFIASWPGCLFTYFFAHCWIDYRSLGADDPTAFGVDAPRVDWFENSRRATITQRMRCIELSSQYRTFAEDRWGVSPSSGRDGYLVPEIRPNLRDEEHLFEGTIAPYAAASAIMFTPRESLEAIRAYRSLKGPDGNPFVWRDPADGGYGFVDSFNLDQNYAHDDYLGIDQGPMLLAIENARTGLIWRLFMAHPYVEQCVKRLKLRK